MPEHQPEPAGVAGLGMMDGGAARRALASAYRVHGCDVLDTATERLAGTGISLRDCTLSGTGGQMRTSGCAHNLHCQLPLFAASAEFYRTALSQGMAAQDPASGFAVLAPLAGDRPVTPVTDQLERG